VGAALATGELHEVDVFDGRGGAQQPMTDLPTARYDLAAASGADGRIYALGGIMTVGGQATDLVEAYDPAADTWATTAPLPEPRAGLAAALGTDGRLYAIGGYDVASAELATVDAYTPATDTWTAVAPLPLARGGLAAVAAPDGRIYALGGRTYARRGGRGGRLHAGHGHVGCRASLPTARDRPASVVGSDRRLYAIGGAQAGRGDLATVEAYDIAAGTWHGGIPAHARSGLVAATAATATSTPRAAAAARSAHWIPSSVWPGIHAPAPERPAGTHGHRDRDQLLRVDDGQLLLGHAGHRPPCSVPPPPRPPAT